MAARPKKGTSVSSDPNAVPGDAPADETPTVEAPVNVVAPADDAPTNPVDPAGAPTADAPVNPAEGDVVADAPADVATDPTTGEQLLAPSGAAVAPLDPAAEPAVEVDPADNQVPVAVEQAQPDPSGAAALVLDKQADPPVAPVVASRSEVAAQAVLDEGTLTPAQPGTAIHPVETLDHRTVDPSGTADDHMPGAATLADPGDTSLSTPLVSLVGGIDQRVAPDDRNKGISNVTPAVAEELMGPVVRVLAESGVHRDLLHQWVDQGYADLQGQNISAQTAGDPLPYPNLVF